MKRLSRDEFAARALPGIIAMPDNHDLSGVEDAAYKVADRMVAFSAPDAIEVLENLVEEIGHLPPSLTGRDSMTHLMHHADTAHTVLARYKETEE